jgi:hypothetical protein
MCVLAPMRMQVALLRPPSLDFQLSVSNVSSQEGSLPGLLQPWFKSFLLDWMDHGQCCLRCPPQAGREISKACTNHDKG